MGVSNPFVPFFIRNLAPPPLQSVDMQGTPKAIASISALGIPSKSYESTNSEWARGDIEAVMTTCVCPDCKGARLTPEIMSVTVGGKNIYEFCSMPISEELEFINNLELTSRQQMIGKLVVNEIRQRLNFLNSVGLDYLSLSREASTLSGGEAQRIRLATQIGSSLMGVLYILDEPTTGLHFEDIRVLMGVLNKLVDKGNTVIVIEHNLDVIKMADYPEQVLTAVNSLQQAVWMILLTATSQLQVCI